MHEDSGTPSPDADPGSPASGREHSRLGRCYAMLTTEANGQKSPVHPDWMPVIFALGDVKEYLRAPDPPIGLVRPFQGELRIEPPPELDLFG